MPEKKKPPKWLYAPIVALLISTNLFICMIIIISSPKPEYQILGKNVAILSGESGQTVSDYVIVLLKPNSKIINNITVSGFFFENVFNTTTGTYDIKEVDEYSKLFLKVSLNDSYFAYNVGSFVNQSLTLTVYNTGFLPIINTSAIKFSFFYTFPKVYYLFSKPTYNVTMIYVFKPSFKFGYEE